MGVDGKYHKAEVVVCPRCGIKVNLDEHRNCPNCGLCLRCDY